MDRVAEESLTTWGRGTLRYTPDPYAVSVSHVVIAETYRFSKLNQMIEGWTARGIGLTIKRVAQPLSEDSRPAGQVR
jgi:hypothetical protein